jgi:hypothetical protein
LSNVTKRKSPACCRALIAPAEIEFIRRHGDFRKEARVQEINGTHRDDQLDLPLWAENRGLTLVYPG